MEEVLLDMDLHIIMDHHQVILALPDMDHLLIMVHLLIMDHLHIMDHLLLIMEVREDIMMMVVVRFFNG
jgi:hypothetical protein